MIEITEQMRNLFKQVIEKEECEATYEECKVCVLGNIVSSKRCWELAKEFLFLIDNQKKLFENDFGYYVFNPSADKPTYRHASLKSAKAEAERLISTGIEATEIQILKIVDKAKVEKDLNWHPEENSETTILGCEK